MLKSSGLHQFWFEHGAATGSNEMPGCDELMRQEEPGQHKLRGPLF